MRQEKGLVCEMDRKEAGVLERMDEPDATSGRIWSPQEGVWTLFSGPFAVKQERGMVWFIFLTITWLLNCR